MIEDLFIVAVTVSTAYIGGFAMHSTETEGCVAALVLTAIAILGTAFLVWKLWL